MSCRRSHWRRFSDRFREFRFHLLSNLGRVILPGYRFSWYQVDWWTDEAFSAYLARFGEAHGHNSLRRWTLWQLLRLVDSVVGDTAECGAYLGASSFLICAANAASRNNGKIHHIFDSFQGISQPKDEDGGYWRVGDLSASEREVIQNLSPFSGYEIHRGWIPTNLFEVEGRSFSFVHIDVDLFEPTIASIEFFYPRVNDGGIIVCDDYGFSTCPGATRAIDEYMVDKAEKFVALPAGGGMMIKGTVTGAAAKVPS